MALPSTCSFEALLLPSVLASIIINGLKSIATLTKMSKTCTAGEAPAHHQFHARVAHHLILSIEVGLLPLVLAGLRRGGAVTGRVDWTRAVEGIFEGDRLCQNPALMCAEHRCQKRIEFVIKRRIEAVIIHLLNCKLGATRKTELRENWTRGSTVIGTLPGTYGSLIRHVAWRAQLAATLN
jgi:hypothetical protein